jgi:predicted nucleic acid-binding protein
MAKVYSFSVPDNEVQLIAILDELKARKALSMEIVRLAKIFYLGNGFNSETISKEMLKLLEAEKTAKEALEMAQKSLSIVEELRPIIEKKQEKQKEIEELPLIRELQLYVFDDIQDYANFEARCRRTGREPKDAIKARLSAWASEKQISYPEAVKLFCKAFPELKVFEEVVVR